MSDTTRWIRTSSLQPVDMWPLHGLRPVARAAPTACIATARRRPSRATRTTPRTTGSTWCSTRPVRCRRPRQRRPRPTRRCRPVRRCRPTRRRLAHRPQRPPRPTRPCQSIARARSSRRPPRQPRPQAAARGVGRQLRSDNSGYITGIRFYKARSETGTHVVNLWTGSGTLLATATSTNETASGLAAGRTWVRRWRSRLARPTWRRITRTVALVIR